MTTSPALEPDLLRLVGELLYGPPWYHELMGRLGVNERTFRRWLKGDAAIPVGVWGELLALIEERGDDVLGQLADGPREVLAALAKK